MAGCTALDGNRKKRMAFTDVLRANVMGEPEWLQSAVIVSLATPPAPGLITGKQEVIGHEKKHTSIFLICCLSVWTRITGSDPVGNSSRSERTRAIEAPCAYLLFSVPQAKTTEPVQPREGTFYDPAPSSQTAAVFRTPHCE